jgi:O-acetyl-ADP-ribose deacetylase (regulator of RNase III)
MTTKEEAREQRKRSFIDSLKRRDTRELVEPLGRKIAAFLDGKLSVEDVFRAVQHVAVQGEKVAKRFRNRPDVVLAEIAMDENKFTTEIHEIGIKARLGDITALFADAIVSPTARDGAMSEGVPAEIKAAGGDGIEKEIAAKAPLAPGTAVATAPGRLPNLRVIHVASTGEGGAGLSAEQVKLSVSAALALAESLKLESIAIPGLGAGVLSPEKSAAAIVDAIIAHEPKSVSDITLVSRDERMVGAFVEVLEKFEEENG